MAIWFQIGRLQVSDQPHSKRAQPFSRLHVLGELVTVSTICLLSLKSTLNVEKFLLRALLANEKLHVVDQDDIIPAIAVTKVIHFVVTQGTHQIIEEFFRGDIARDHASVRLLHVVANGMQQMRFAQPYITVDKEGIIGACRMACHRQAGGMSKLIT
jgi:hypothetical protein